ncbi:hypothetical protein DL770_007781 [Monosporascus sp. CRB-9-2]|nr:hypothetical protein DL770_007781 [Monosporascus sp. CRB-9-2]
MDFGDVPILFLGEERHLPVEAESWSHLPAPCVVFLDKIFGFLQVVCEGALTAGTSLRDYVQLFLGLCIRIATTCRNYFGVSALNLGVLSSSMARCGPPLFSFVTRRRGTVHAIITAVVGVYLLWHVVGTALGCRVRLSVAVAGKSRWRVTCSLRRTPYLNAPYRTFGVMMYHRDDFPDTPFAQVDPSQLLRGGLLGMLPMLAQLRTAAWLASCASSVLVLLSRLLGGQHPSPDLNPILRMFHPAGLAAKMQQARLILVDLLPYFAVFAFWALVVVIDVLEDAFRALRHGDNFLSTTYLGADVLLSVFVVNYVD